MIKLAHRVDRISPSVTLAIASRARALKAAGVDVCDFSAGEPDFITPAPMREAAKEALDAGKTKYTPTAGLPELRARIAGKLRRENALPYTSDQVLVTTGGKQALFNVLLALLDAGDECLIPAPAWVSYPEMVKLSGATPRLLPTDESTDFKITAQQLRDAITSRTRVLILNTPANPTGTVYTREELAALAEIIVAHDLVVIADEIYEKLTYDGYQHVSLGSLGPSIFSHTVTCNGFSKAYAATGWRLGYAAGPREVIQAAAAIQSHSTSGANTFAQHGALAAFDGLEGTVEAMRTTFQARRDLVLAELRTIPGISCATPHGAFYVFPNIGATGLDSVSFCERLLETMHVAAVPGRAFGSDTNIRLSYATDTETLKEGLQRIRRFVSELSS